MKKTLAALMAALALGLASCGNTPQKDINIDNLAADLTAKVSFVDELSEMGDEMIPMVYDISFSDAAVYMGSGATAEEVAVFACEDDGAAKTALEQAKAHIASQKEAFENYVPEEVKRLDEAIVQQSGKYVVVVVTEDTKKASEVLKDYLG